MMAFVLDCSVAVAWVFPDEAAGHADTELAAGARAADVDTPATG